MVTEKPAAALPSRMLSASETFHRKQKKESNIQCTFLKTKQTNKKPHTDLQVNDKK